MGIRMESKTMSISITTPGLEAGPKRINVQEIATIINELRNYGQIDIAKEKETISKSVL
jgi:hypothetical protein